MQNKPENRQTQMMQSHNNPVVLHKLTNSLDYSCYNKTLCLPPLDLPLQLQLLVSLCLPWLRDPVVEKLEAAYQNRLFCVSN